MAPSIAVAGPSTLPTQSNIPSDSPPILTPATPSTVNKPLAPMPGSVNAPTISINREWVLPPKPKPGRKPAVDTPPTKRKAQNREAQRAFRERRAAKVGELEEEMKRMEQEDAREQEALREIIRQMERRVDHCEKMTEIWRDRFNEMQMACERERQLREKVESDLTVMRGSMTNNTEAVPLPSRTKKSDEHPMHQTNSVQETNGSQGCKFIANDIPVGCGKCSDDTRCQCIEEAFEMGNFAAEETPDQSFKRPHSPPSNAENKRIRPDPDTNEDTEIDFTAQFSTRRPPTLQTTTSTASSSIPATAPSDPCGFCSDGTLCLCAELSKHQDAKPLSSHPPNPAPPTQTPTSAKTDSNPCINGPGTCAQCLSNPTSTLFCKSVAAANNIPRQTLPQLPHPTTTNPPQPPTTTKLTCADAFTTLSRHPRFSAATNELNTWVPQLTAIPKVSCQGSVEEVPRRTAFDIEAASVMSVLKFFDRRFGAER
ncbi:hypothetical protein ACLMJK_001320 [Lecanora helva]